MKKIICVGLIGVIIIKIFFVDLIKVSGDSMNPTIKNMEYVFINKIIDKYSSGDIILIKKDGKQYIKRILAIEGDKLNYNKHFYVNDIEIELGNFYSDDELKKLDNYILKKDDFFVVGDNVKESIDSRLWGIVYREEIQGKINR